MSKDNNTLTKFNNHLGLFNELSSGIWRDLFDDPFFGYSRGWKLENWKETDKSHIFEVELPRFKREQIEISVEDNQILRIKADNGNSKYIKSIKLNNVDFNKSDIKLEDGVLTITTPKIESKDPQVKKLEIK